MLPQVSSSFHNDIQATKGANSAIDSILFIVTYLTYKSLEQDMPSYLGNSNSYESSEKVYDSSWEKSSFDNFEYNANRPITKEEEEHDEALVMFMVQYDEEDEDKEMNQANEHEMMMEYKASQKF